MNTEEKKRKEKKKTGPVVGEAGPGAPSPSPDELYIFADQLDDGGRTDDRAAAKESRFDTYTVFVLEGESYAISIKYAEEIVRVPHITRVPHSPPLISGVIQLRGKIIPLINIKKRLGLSERETGERSRIIVITSRGRTMGILADSVDRVERICQDDIEPAPPEVLTEYSDYIYGVKREKEEMVIFLDVDKLLWLKEKGVILCSKEV